MSSFTPLSFAAADKEEASTQPEWRPALDVLMGSRHGGRVHELLDALRDLDRRHPNVAEINYQLAWTYEVLERETEAVPLYEKAISLGLPENELCGALLGLGNTLRVTGEVARAVEVLCSASAQFPDNKELDAFLALALHATGKHTESVQTLIEALCETSEDTGITAYQRALRHHASRL